MFQAIKNIFDPNVKLLKKYWLEVEKINKFGEKCEKLSSEELAKKTDEFRDKIKSGKSLDEILPEAFAVVREAVYRTIGERAFDVQLLAAICLHHGKIAEQKTGEGKTHSVIFPAYLNALSGEGVHVVTPNDYLTRVGTGWYPRALYSLGIKTACIVHDNSYIYDPEYVDNSEKHDERLAHLRPISRQEAYKADITYGTNNEFGFDYLRDHIAYNKSDIVQRKHNFAIVDEVDFALIDEARTPLIISSPDTNPTDKYYKFAQIANQLQPQDYIVDEKEKSATLTEYGIRKVERVLKVENLYQESFDTIHHIENAIKAISLFKKDRDYVIKDGEIIIVDEFTGRLMPGRRWSNGLHQAIEAKESVTVQQESKTWATITFQNYFKLYKKLSGMTGTAITEAEEFRKIYDLETLVIPTHRKLQRVDKHDLIYKNQRGKYAAIANKIEELHKKGQPVLIGTTSIEKNEIVSQLLRKKGVPHQLLNAKNHQTEAEIISNAGKVGAVTVATNMAGRGVDIILGGSKEGVDPKKWKEDHERVVELGGLYVIGTERHESRRIDNQLRGRSGRQGDPGESQFYIALDDDLMRIFGGEKISALMGRMNMAEDTAITHPLISGAIEQIQVKVEGFHFDIRKSLVEYDNVINKQRQVVYSIREKAIEKRLRNLKEIKDKLDKELIRIDMTSDDNKKFFLELCEIIPIHTDDLVKIKERFEKVEDRLTEARKMVKQMWKQKKDMLGSEVLKEMGKYAVISTLDPLWVDHLTALDNLKDSVRLRGYAQKDPLIEYRKEGFTMFQNLIDQLNYNMCRKIFRFSVKNTTQESQSDYLSEGRGEEVDMSKKVDSVQVEEAKESSQGATRKAKSNIKAPNRNDPCPCGSGKKYKKCCYPKFG